MDFNVPGDVPAAIYYFDDISQVGNTNSITCVEPIATEIPLTFDCEFVDYAASDFAGASTEIADNPDAAGINTSAKVLQYTKNGAPFAGTFIDLDSPIDFSIGTQFTLKVWSPKMNSPVLLKLENSEGLFAPNEIPATTSTSNSWEELTFDFSGTDISTKTIDRITLFMDFNVAADGMIYYIDDINQVGNTNSIPCEDPSIVIPTMGQWALFILALLMSSIGLVYITRKSASVS